MCGCCVLSEDAVWCAVCRRKVLLSCDVCLCLCCLLLSQVVAVSGPFRPVSSSAPVVSGGAVAAERCPHVCEGELCGVSSPSVRLGWNSPCLSSPLYAYPLSAPLLSLSVNGVQCFNLQLQHLFVTSVHSTTHAPHISTLIPCNTERCRLVTMWSVQEA